MQHYLPPANTTTWSTWFSFFSEGIRNPSQIIRHLTFCACFGMNPAFLSRQVELNRATGDDFSVSSGLFIQHDPQILPTKHD